MYSRARKFGGKLNVVVWQSAFVTVKFKSVNIKFFCNGNYEPISNLDLTIPT